MGPPCLQLLPRSRALLTLAELVQRCDVVVALFASAAGAGLAELVCSAALDADLLAAEGLEVVIMLALLAHLPLALAAVGDTGLLLTINALRGCGV